MNLLALYTAAVFFSPQAGGSQPSQAIHAAMNEAFSVNGLTYTVTGIKDGVASYTQKYDQRESEFSPGYKTESLAVVEVVVDNPTEESKPFLALVPSLTFGDGSVTDHAQWDVEQRSLVRSTNDIQVNPQGLFSYALDPVMVGPRGKARFAIVFSHPKRSRATQITFQPGVSYATAGVLVTYPAEGKKTIVSISG